MHYIYYLRIGTSLPLQYNFHKDCSSQGKEYEDLRLPSSLVNGSNGSLWQRTTLTTFRKEKACT